jgi:hypothetical protein
MKLDLQLFKSQDPFYGISKWTCQLSDGENIYTSAHAILPQHENTDMELFIKHQMLEHVMKNFIKNACQNEYM